MKYVYVVVGLICCGLTFLWGYWLAAQQTNVSLIKDRMSRANHVGEKLGEYYAKHEQLPRSLAELKLDPEIRGHFRLVSDSSKASKANSRQPVLVEVYDGPFCVYDDLSVQGGFTEYDVVSK
jgi:hypothetical protein